MASGTPTTNPSKENVANKAQDMASNVADKAREAAATVADKAKQAASAVGQGAENATHGLGSGMKSLGETLRGMANDLTDLIRRNPIPALLIGVGIGFILARATSRS